MQTAASNISVTVKVCSSKHHHCLRLISCIVHSCLSHYLTVPIAGHIVDPIHLLWHINTACALEASAAQIQTFHSDRQWLTTAKHQQGSHPFQQAGHCLCHSQLIATELSQTAWTSDLADCFEY